MKSTQLTAIVVLLAALAPVARADTITLAGTDATRGGFTVDLSYEGPNDRVEVVEIVRWASGTEERRRGTGTRTGDRLEARLTDERGVADVIDPTPRLSDVTLFVSFFDEGELEARATDATGERVARGKKERLTWSDFKDKPGKHLLALGRKELEKRAAEGIGFDTDLSLGSYLHLGVGSHVRWLRPEVLTADQARELRSGTGKNAWIVSEVIGAPRVAHSVSVPVGEVTLSIGFDAGARVRYEVTDLYPLPESIKDGETMAEALRSLGKRTFDLPLDTAEALALTPGARRVMDGEAAVAVSGALQVGREVTHFGDDVVRVGATARVGGWYRLQGNLRIEVARLSGQACRVRVTRGTTVSRGAQAELFLGAAIDHAKLAARLSPATDYIDSAKVRDLLNGAVTDAAESAIKDALRFELRGSVSGAVENELDLSYRFDLNAADARAAYEKAVKGDLRLAGDVCGQPGSGVTLEHRVVGQEKNTYSGADLVVSVLLKAGFSKRVRFADIDVIDGEGVARFEVFSFIRQRQLELVAGRRRARTMSMDVVRRQTPDGAVARSLRWTLDIEDPSTTSGDAGQLRRAIAAWGVSSEPGVDDRRTALFRSAYGQTRTNFAVEIGEPGIAKILSVTEQEAIQAYADAFTALEGEAPEWSTPAGRAHMDSYTPSNDDHEARRAEAQLRTCRTFAKGLTSLAKSVTAEERAERLRKLANGSRYDLYAVTALLTLAPRNAVKIDAAIRGERIVVEGAYAGVDAGLVVVRDPR